MTEPDTQIDAEDEALELAVELAQKARDKRDAQEAHKARQEATEEAAEIFGADAYLGEARKQVARRRADADAAARKAETEARERRGQLTTLGLISAGLLGLGGVIAAMSGDDHAAEAPARRPSASATPAPEAPPAPDAPPMSRRAERARAMDMADEQADWREELRLVEQRIAADSPDGCRAKWDTGESCYANGRMLSALAWEEEQNQLRLRATQLRRNLATAVGR
jgi:hypothetical protein